MKRNKYSRFRKALPFMQGGGTIQPMIPKYTSQLNLLQSSVNISKVPSVASQSGSMTGGSNIDWGSTLYGAGMGALQGAASGSSGVGSAVSGAVQGAISSIPMVGQIASAAQSITGPIGSTIGEASPTNTGAQIADAWLNPISNISGGLGNLVSGDEPADESFLQMMSGTSPEFTILYGIMQANEAKEEAAKRESKMQKASSAKMIGTSRQENPGRFYDTNQMLMAAYGGPLSQPMQNMQQMGQPNQMPQVTEYNTGGTHEESLTGGIPVDSEGNLATVSGGRAVALTEAGEVAWKNPKSSEVYVFSDKIFI